jgi:Fe-S cluster assembly scaffold protein SufB
MMEIRRTVSSRKSETIELPEGDVDIVFEILDCGELDMTIRSRNKKPQQVNLSVIHRGKGVSAIRLNSIIKSSLRLDAKLVMEKDSAGSVGKVSMNGIKIGKDAKADFSPKLVLLNGDVDVSHKSSIQEIPEQAVSYLMGRGIAKKTAQSLFCERFLSQ